MAKIPSYKKDEETGAVIFHDATAYVQRKKIIQQTKLSNIVKINFDKCDPGTCSLLKGPVNLP